MSNTTTLVHGWKLTRNDARPPSAGITEHSLGATYGGAVPSNLMQDGTNWSIFPNYLLPDYSGGWRVHARDSGVSGSGLSEINIGDQVYMTADPSEQCYLVFDIDISDAELYPPGTMVRFSDTVSLILGSPYRSYNNIVDIRVYNELNMEIHDDGNRLKRDGESILLQNTIDQISAGIDNHRNLEVALPSGHLLLRIMVHVDDYNTAHPIVLTQIGYSNPSFVTDSSALLPPDPAIMAFTDCDIDLLVDGVNYLASAALTPSEAVASLGLAVDEQEVQGALSSAAISESDLAAGLYDGAAVEVIEIDWAAQAKTEIIGTYYLGEVTRTEAAFSAELRSEVGVLAQRRGRYVTVTCDAELGDVRCGFGTAGLTEIATITGTNGEAEYTVSGLDSVTPGLFSRGTIVWKTGANVGQVQEVRIHQGALVGLWRSPSFEVVPGDSFNIVPGCDKSFATCRNLFFNSDNFRGFPALVGENAFNYSNNGDAGLDGGSRNDF